MTRGNQRDRDRERAQSRAGGKTKHLKNHGFTPQQRRERNCVLENDEFANIHAPTIITRVGMQKALQEKAAKKAVQDSGGNNAGGGRGKI
ncbi:hypothetical protein PHAVU_010G019201 [Phaseolus vulgaris]